MYSAREVLKRIQHLTIWLVCCGLACPRRGRKSKSAPVTSISICGLKLNLSSSYLYVKTFTHTHKKTFNKIKNKIEFMRKLVDTLGVIS